MFWRNSINAIFRNSDVSRAIVLHRHLPFHDHRPAKADADLSKTQRHRYVLLMPDIDQDPRDYRAEPLKGEPVFRPGGLRILLAFFVVIGFGVFVAVAVRLTAGPFIQPFSEWASCSITSTCD